MKTSAWAHATFGFHFVIQRICNNRRGLECVPNVSHAEKRIIIGLASSMNNQQYQVPNVQPATGCASQQRQVGRELTRVKLSVFLDLEMYFFTQTNFVFITVTKQIFKPTPCPLINKFGFSAVEVSLSIQRGDRKV